MQSADKVLNFKPSFSVCSELIEQDILNKQADDELLHFQKNKTFLYKHPLAAQKKFEQDSIESLRQLKTSNPLQFINEITNISQNIRRIESQIRKKKYRDDEMLQSWEENLMRAKMKREILTNMIK